MRFLLTPSWCCIKHVRKTAFCRTTLSFTFFPAFERLNAALTFLTVEFTITIVNRGIFTKKDEMSLDFPS